MADEYRRPASNGRGRAYANQLARTSRERELDRVSNTESNVGVVERR
jgi:hypothetical protein